jgi:hypothetical protein
VSHIILDEVHERNLDSDLLLLLLRRALLVAKTQAQQGGQAQLAQLAGSGAGHIATHSSSSIIISSSSSSPALPFKLVLMSATADAELFGDYFSTAALAQALLLPGGGADERGGDGCIGAGGSSSGSGGSRGGSAGSGGRQRQQQTTHKQQQQQQQQQQAQQQQGRQGQQGQQQQQRRLSVGLLTIPGFTHPVRQLWLEDALAHTRTVIGRASRWGC